ncbi:MAG TPA: ABC transporter permease subunit [Sedimentisphaerales bacterium]|jgi:ABC-type transport system involved in multi-copper enzyme maturation permease subunit|nr:ABC transporter permease subunit [Sedimentisphaerales bacterium]HNU29878.1 ABC transporter permease subunit [Sedimentisphaerales bacterium]
MGAIVLNWIVRVLSLAWLTGPIFDKELRVSSRRRRNYVLRFLYIGLFTLLLALIWAEAVPYRSTSAYQSSRMGQAGQAIVGTVLWFEFIAAQVIAIVMLSTSISDEIYHRTLGVLMTTPISSFQIVVGKLLSKLLQLVLLLAMSLPLLAIVRVFGGVAWDIVVGGLCVTLATSLFVGSLSVFFSIFTRRAYSVILMAFGALGFLFAGLPLVVALLAYYPDKSPTMAFWQGLGYVNPYYIMGKLTDSLVSTRNAGSTHWLIHCDVLVGASLVLLLLSVILVRKAALRQAMGQTGLWSRRGARGPEVDHSSGRVRRVVGPPVLWRECRAPLLGKRKVMTLVTWVMVLALLGLTYWLFYRQGDLDDDGVHGMYIILFFMVGLLFTAVLPATCIASEKESQTWTLLLTTSIRERAILAGKFGGVLRRCLAVWMLLFGHLLAFTFVGYIHPAAVLQLGLVVAWVLVFLSCTGLYFSARCRHTTTAVIANMGLAATLWAIVPLILVIVAVIGRHDDDLFSACLDANPVVQAGVIAMATTHRGELRAYDWAQGGMRTAGGATGWILLIAFLHVMVGLAIAAWTVFRMRRHPLS